MATSINSRIKRTIPLLIAVCFISFPTYAQYGGGTGEPNNPYLIYTGEHLNAIGADPNDWDKHFKLMADIDLNDLEGAPINMIGEPHPFFPVFNGDFDGNKHVIKNFKCYRSEGTGVGLFRSAGENAVIKNLGLIDPNIIEGGQDLGALVGFHSGTIQECFVHGGTIKGSYRVGGLVGYNAGGRVFSCRADEVEVLGDNAGGLVGCNEGVIRASHSNVNVSGSTVGGLVADNGGLVAVCSSASNVQGSGEYAGGLVGKNSTQNFLRKGTIVDSYAHGEVSGYAMNIGGLVGHNPGEVGGGLNDERDDGRILRCYSVGYVSTFLTDTHQGGLVGENWGEIIDSFWDIETSGQSRMCGSYDPTNACKNENGKPTVKMQDSNTFLTAGWDFAGEYNNGPSDYWVMPTDGGYPALWFLCSPMPDLPTFSGGSGEPNDPYLISTAMDLNRIGCNPRLMDAHFKITDTISLTQMRFFTIGSDIFPFVGGFDGDNYAIYDFKYNVQNESCVGLFRCVAGTGAHIQDVTLLNANVYTDLGDSVGALVGHLVRGTITGCSAESGSVQGRDRVDRVGGLVGYSNQATITDCHSTTSVSGYNYVGGLVGYSDQTIITDCHSTTSVSGHKYVGGLLGYNNVSGRIAKCYSTGALVSSSWADSSRLGGLVGDNGGNITTSYSNNTVSGNREVGGLVGSNGVRSSITTSYSSGPVGGKRYVGGFVGRNYGIITASYSSGPVKGDYLVGGLLGNEYPGYGIVTDCFWDMETSGQSSSDGGTGKTTAEMQTASTFLETGWDFVGEMENGTEDIWWINEGQNYPRLWWEAHD